MKVRELVLLAPSSELASGRGGVISRFVVGGLLVSHGARADAKVAVIFDGERCVAFEGWRMRNVRPDEQSLSGILRAGLNKADRGGRVMQGITASRRTLREVIEGWGSKGGRYYYSGAHGKASAVASDFLAIFEYPEMQKSTEEALCAHGFEKLKLGRRDLFPDQAVVLLNNIADLRVPAGATPTRG